MADGPFSSEQDRAEFRENLAALIESRQRFDGDDRCWAIAATQPRVAPAQPAARPDDPVGPAKSSVERPSAAAQRSAGEEFFPVAPSSLREAGLTESEVEALVLKFLLNRGTASGMCIAEQIALPFQIVDQLLRSLKIERLVAHHDAASLNDFNYQLTDHGAERARRYSKQCTYFGAAPISLEDYIEGVRAQSLTRLNPTMDDLRAAYADLTLDDEVLARIGRAICSGKGLFLYGAPGNGKTCIAERVTRVYGQSIWIPRAISVWGEIIRLYDPSNHEALPVTSGNTVVREDASDQRWVRIRRPTIVVGGELTMSNLEITTNHDTGIAEAPLQMKSNCGTLVIDDFGRQRIRPTELLNRWIVPLEKRYDYLNLSSGRKIQVPFDQFVVFATNMEPRDLVDEAFLRRIPYKIDTKDPAPERFRQLFTSVAAELKIAFSEQAYDHLVHKHYEATGRPMRFCHPRDLLHHIGVFCHTRGCPREMTIEAIDAAAADYFCML